MEVPPVLGYDLLYCSYQELLKKKEKIPLMSKAMIFAKVYEVVGCYSRTKFCTRRIFWKNPGYSTKSYANRLWYCEQ